MIKQDHHSRLVDDTTDTEDEQPVAKRNRRNRFLDDEAEEDNRWVALSFLLMFEVFYANLMWQLPSDRRREQQVVALERDQQVFAGKRQVGRFTLQRAAAGGRGRHEHVANLPITRQRQRRCVHQRWRFVNLSGYGQRVG